MKVKLIQIEPALGAFVTIIRASLPIKTSYAINKNIKKLSSEFEDFEKVRRDVVKKYGKEDEKGNCQVTPENMEIFNKEYAELSSQEVEIDIWKIQMSKIINSNANVTPMQLMALDDFIDDDVPDEKKPVIPPATPVLTDDSVPPAAPITPAPAAPVPPVLPVGSPAVQA